MKKLLIAMLAIFTLSFTVCPTVAYADWSHGTAKFKGNKPKKSKSTGNVIFYYNGTLKKVGSQGNADVWECTEDVCVVYPKNYNGKKLIVKSKKKNADLSMGDTQSLTQNKKGELIPSSDSLHELVIKFEKLKA